MVMRKVQIKPGPEAITAHLHSKKLQGHSKMRHVTVKGIKAIAKHIRGRHSFKKKTI